MVRIRSLEERPTFGRFSLCNPFLIAAAPGIATGIASIGSGIINAFSGNKANKQNIAMQRETNALNYKMFQEGNAFNRNMAIDMFNRENAYNTPEAQVERMKQAGLNPAALSEGLSSSSGNGDVSTPSSVSPTPMVAPQVQPIPNPMVGMFDALDKLAGAFQKVKSGQLSDKQGDFVLEQAKESILKQKSLDIQNSIADAYGMQEADAKVKKLLKDIDEAQSRIDLAVKQGNYYDADAALKRVQKIAQKNENELFSKTFDFQVQAAQEKVNLLRAEVKTEEERAKTEGAKQSNLYSGSALNHQLVDESKSRQNLNEQQYDYIKDTQVWTKALLEASAENAQYNLIENKATILDRIEQVKKLPGLTQASIDELNQRAEALRKSNSVFNQRFALEVLHEITGAFVGYTQGMENATGATKNVVVPFR